LQIARGLAALSVVVTHSVAAPFGGSAPDIWHMLGRYGVTLFFIISGFIMVHTTGTGPFNARGFMSSRLRRIVPLYFVANLVLAILALVAPQLFRRTVFELKHVLLSLLFIPAYDPAGTGSIWPFFRLGWTLNYEMFFYLCFAALAGLAANRRVVVLALLFGTLILIGQIHPFQAAIPHYYTQIDTLGFAAGAMLGLCELHGRLPTSRSVAVFLLVASFGAWLLIDLQYDAIRDAIWTQVATVLICSAHLVLLNRTFDFKGARAPAALLYIGDISYSLYLFHMFPVGIFGALEHRLPHVLMIPLIGCSVLASLAVGAFVYHQVERRLTDQFRHRRSLRDATKSDKVLNEATV
jgi:exopolysaccharide production protein ExoZ